MGRRQTKDQTKEGWEQRVGQLAVYPGYGVVRIEGLCYQAIGGRRRAFLAFRMMEDDSRILIPREKVEAAGLRAVIGRKDAKRVWEILKTHPTRPRRTGITWSRQFREYRQKLRTGTPFEVAEVLRDLLRLKSEKELSFGERRVLDSARSLLVHELAAAQRTRSDQIEARLRESLG